MLARAQLAVETPSSHETNKEATLRKPPGGAYLTHFIVRDGQKAHHESLLIHRKTKGDAQCQRDDGGVEICAGGQTL